MGADDATLFLLLQRRMQLFEAHLALWRGQWGLA